MNTKQTWRIEAPRPFSKGFSLQVILPHSTLEQAEQHSAMVAAAPELLEALEQAAATLAVIASHDSGIGGDSANALTLNALQHFAREQFFKTRAAIAKATGKS